jgi:NTP pyrophosphatase (non-canonical NTP hydrolase)
MELNLYQERAGDSDNCGHLGFTYYGLGLVGEAGEVAEKLKKHFRDDAYSLDDKDLTAERRAAIKKELGDTLWYVARLAAHCGFTLDEVAQDNIDKLADRMARGVLGGSGDNR